MLFKAAAAFGIAAAVMGTGPLAGPLNPGWQRVKAGLAAARPQARLASQAAALFQPGLPRPAGVDR